MDDFEKIGLNILNAIEEAMEDLVIKKYVDELVTQQKENMMRLEGKIAEMKIHILHKINDSHHWGAQS